MRILDSSVLVGLHIINDLHHARATELCRAIPAGEFILLNDYVVNEVTTVSLRKGGLVKAREVLDFMLNNQQFNVHHTPEEEFNRIISRFKSQSSTLSFVDCSILELAKAEGCRVETFDKVLQAEINAAHEVQS